MRQVHHFADPGYLWLLLLIPLLILWYWMRRHQKGATLTFSNLDIKVYGGNAVVFGRWDLERDLMDIGGLFTLLFEKQGEGWRIIADHTSSDDLPIAALDK